MVSSVVTSLASIKSKVAAVEAELQQQRTKNDVSFFLLL
jgi:hypothetical protein